MRTLFISNVIAEHLHAGSFQRVFRLLQAIARVSEVTFVAPAPDGKWNGTADPFRPLCGEMYFYPRESFFGWNWDSQPLTIRRLATVARLFRTKEPEIFQWYRSVEGTRLVEQLCLRQFDLVWVERFFSLSLLPSWLKTRVVVDLDDLEHRKLRREISIAWPARRVVLKYLDLLKLCRFEYNLPKLPYELVVCSKTDKGILGGGTNIWVVPNGIEIPTSGDEFEIDCPDPVFAFVGGMDYGPNVDAVQFFGRQILPLIQREVPAARFVIVGRGPVAAVRELDDGKTVHVTGRVPEVEPYLRQAAVVVAPLRVGGGTRIKILEAMAHRRPVVATSIGAEGLDVESGRDLLIADSPSRFAEACVLLLRDREMRLKLAARAFDFVRTKHEWSKIQGWVEQIAARGGEMGYRNGTAGLP